MTDQALTLHVDAFFISPYAMTAFVALEEKGLPYTLQTVALQDRAQHGPGYRARTHRVPALQHGDYWLAESSAIGEYLAETFPSSNGYPRLFPADLRDRGICREVQAWLRSDLMPLRIERPTTTLWYAPTTEPLSPAGRAAADKLIAAAGDLIAEGATTLFDAWCIADTDLGLMLQRLKINGEPLPARLATYADAQWRRPSVARWHDRVRPPYVAYSY